MDSIFSKLIQQAMDKRGWNLRDLSLATREVDKQLKTNPEKSTRDYGVSASALSYLTTKYPNPELRTLLLLSATLDIPLYQWLLSLGYDPHTGAAALMDRREQVVAMLTASDDATFDFVQRMMDLPANERAFVKGFLDAVAKHSTL